MKKLRILSLLLVLLMALSLSACSKDDGGKNKGSTETTTPTSEATEASTSEAAEASTPEETPQADPDEYVIASDKYSITVPKLDTVLNLENAEYDYSHSNDKKFSVSITVGNMEESYEVVIDTRAYISSLEKAMENSNSFVDNDEEKYAACEIAGFSAICQKKTNEKLKTVTHNYVVAVPSGGFFNFYVQYRFGATSSDMQGFEEAILKSLKIA